jgi:hypothetical protein
MMPIETVAIWEEGHIRRTLNTVEGAARCLTERWPGDRALKSYAAACKACLSALDGSGTPAKARAAIVRAAKDAGIIADVPRPPERTKKPRAANRRG